MVDKDNTKYLIGIDEVGRGPIAGPVAVCSFISTFEFIDLLPKKFLLRDSKKLSKKQRDEWFEYLRIEKEKGNCNFAVSYVSAEWIDKVGIVRSIQKALIQSLDRVAPLNLKNSEFFKFKASKDMQNFLNPANFSIFLDGGLKAPKQYVNQETIIKGDELCPSISLASIIAKVSRDNIMKNFSIKYKEYGFDKNSGYGTKAHYQAIKKYGISEIHRKSFIH